LARLISPGADLLLTQPRCRAAGRSQAPRAGAV